MNDQLLNSYYYTPHFSNYVVRGLSFCLLGRGVKTGRGGKRRKREKQYFFSLSLFLYSPPVSNALAGCTWRWANADPAPAPAGGEGAGVDEMNPGVLCFSAEQSVCREGGRDTRLRWGFPRPAPCVSGLDVAPGGSVVAGWSGRVWCWLRWWVLLRCQPRSRSFPQKGERRVHN